MTLGPIEPELEATLDETYTTVELLGVYDVLSNYYYRYPSPVYLYRLR